MQWLREKTGKPYWLFTALVVSLVVLSGLAILIVDGYHEPKTIYFVVDATEKIQPLFDQVRTQIQIAASLLREDSRIGLRVYGGDGSATSDCQDSRQLLEPSEYPQARKVLDWPWQECNLAAIVQ